MATFKQDAVRDIAPEIPDCCGNCEWAASDVWLYCVNPKNWQRDPNESIHWTEADNMVMFADDCVGLDWTFTCGNHKREVD